MSIKIGVMGDHSFDGAKVANLLSDEENLFVMVDISKQNHVTDYVVVNGQIYIDKIKQVQDATRKAIGSKRLSALAAIAASVSYPYNMYMTDNNFSRERKLDRTINIVKEYGLIEQKACKLSKWEREKVTQLFNERYEKIDSINLPQNIEG